MTTIQASEDNAQSKYTSALASVENIEKQTSETIARLQEEAKQDIEAQVSGSRGKTTIKQSGSSVLSVDKKKRDVATKYVVDALWGFIK